uniref:Uncharacterized protein n=1 Tax=Trichogramma kaykai TaxID=54128 RepID=A0ABD2VSG5_9HYME
MNPPAEINFFVLAAGTKKAAFLEGELSSNRPAAKVEKNSRKDGARKPELLVLILANGVHHSRRKSANTRKSTDPSVPRLYPKGWSPISELLVLALTDGVSTHHGRSQKKARGARKRRRSGILSGVRPGPLSQGRH